jgi:hypothetical protein
MFENVRICVEGRLKDKRWHEDHEHNMRVKMNPWLKKLVKSTLGDKVSHEESYEGNYRCKGQPDFRTDLL